MIIVWLNDSLVKCLLEIPYEVFVACDETPKRYLKLELTLHDKTIWKRKMWRERQNKDHEIQSSACLIA